MTHNPTDVFAGARRARIGVAMAALGAWSACAAGPDREAVDSLRALGKSFAAAAKGAIPAVVYIETEPKPQARASRPRYYIAPFGPFGDQFLWQAPDAGDEPASQASSGSGFIVSRDGLILTGHHVVADAGRIKVKTHDGRELEARLVGSDEKSEVAVLKIDGGPFPCVALGDSRRLQVGDWVLAIGNPYGLSETLTAGVVSAKGRHNLGLADYEDFIQTDAAINPGSSGGPLLDVDGRVVGINAAIYSESGEFMGISFAVPINAAAAVKEQLVRNGRVVRGYLGVSVQDLTPELAEHLAASGVKGLLVAGVLPGSAAEKAGLKEGDIITRVEGEEAGTASAFRNAVAGRPPRSTFRLTLLREGRTRQLTVTSEALPEEKVASSSEPAAGDVYARLGLEVERNARPRGRRSGPREEAGVMVAAVDPRGPAAAAGIEPGSLVLAVDRTPVSSPESFHRAAAAALKTGRDVLMHMRDRRRTWYAVVRPR